MKKGDNRKENTHTTREGWLQAATNELRPYFSGYGYTSRKISATP